MKRALLLLVPSLLWAGMSIPPSAPGELTGDWHLNVERSRWGSVSKPVSVVVHIEHSEPEISYFGQVVYANEDARDFAFQGAVDGRPYPVMRSFGTGKIVLKRLDLWSIESVTRSDCGNFVETARTTLSQDGKTLTRRLRLQAPDNVKTWTEVYERR